jgi:hypothetical protein
VDRGEARRLAGDVRQFLLVEHVQADHDDPEDDEERHREHEGELDECLAALAAVSKRAAPPDWAAHQ